MSYLLWAVKIGKPDWDESVITENRSKKELAKKWAIANGFNRFRETEIDDNPPDFVSTLKKRKHGE